MGNDNKDLILLVVQLSNNRIINITSRSTGLETQLCEGRGETPHRRLTHCISNVYFNSPADRHGTNPPFRSAENSYPVKGSWLRIFTLAEKTVHQSSTLDQRFLH